MVTSVLVQAFRRMVVMLIIEKNWRFMSVFFFSWRSPFAHGEDLLHRRSQDGPSEQGRDLSGAQIDHYVGLRAQR